jgi:hypothetical protein
MVSWTRAEGLNDTNCVPFIPLDVVLVLLVGLSEVVFIMLNKSMS